MHGGEHSFDDALLERYLDGELAPRQVADLEAAAERDPALQAQLRELRELRELLQAELMAPAEQVDFDGLADRVLAQVQSDPVLPWTERLGAWLGEVFTYQKPIWAPSLALATAAALVLVLPRAIDPGSEFAAADIVANAGVEVRSLDTGTQLAMVYQLPNTQTTVIWIADTADEAEGRTP